MTANITGLYILVDFEKKRINPRICTSREAAEKFREEQLHVLGQDYEIKSVFINDEK